MKKNNLLPLPANQRNDWRLSFGSKQIDLAERTYLMGILNVTPDSFSDGGVYFSHDRAIQRGLEMVDEGADFIDIGGESTRPGAQTISNQEELDRVIPVVEALSKQTDAVLSIDTRKSSVAREAVSAGARLVNDVSGFVFDPEIIRVAIRHDVPIVLMHSQGTPETMQQNPKYAQVIDEICDFFKQQIEFATSQGLTQSQIILDPGIGFGKTVQHNYQIIRNFSMFQNFECVLLSGVSRKSFIGAVLNQDASNRLMGTAAAVAASILNGAHIVRVHDVKEMKQVALIADAIKNADKLSESSL